MNFEKIADFVNSTINEFYEGMQNNPDEFLEKTQKEIKNMKNTRAAVVAWQMLENAKNDFILKNPDFFRDKEGQNDNI